LHYPAPRFDAVLASVGATPLLGDMLRYTLTPLVGLLMLPITLRIMFAPCPLPEQFGRNFPRLMMLRPWQLPASLGDGAVMRQSAAELKRGYGALQVPTFIAAGGDDCIVIPSQSEKLHQDVRGSELQIIRGVGHMVQHSAPDHVAAVVHRVIGTMADGVPPTPQHGALPLENCALSLSLCRTNHA